MDSHSHTSHSSSSFPSSSPSPSPTLTIATPTARQPQQPQQPQQPSPHLPIINTPLPLIPPPQPSFLPTSSSLSSVSHTQNKPTQPTLTTVDTKSSTKFQSETFPNTKNPTTTLKNQTTNQPEACKTPAEFSQLEKINKDPIKRIFEAISMRNVRLVKYMIKQGANINEVCPQNGLVPLTTATKLCNNEMVQVLLENGAKPSVPDKQGWTAVHWSAALNNLVAIKLLCRHGADIYGRTHGGRMPIDLARLKDHKEMVAFLLDWSKISGDQDNKLSAKAIAATEVAPVNIPFGTPFHLRKLTPEEEKYLEDPNRKRICMECNTKET
eukprot:Ihof_evm3s365 gene=Ihof_evmTU3s365